MVKKAPKNAKERFKYGMPLFGVAWPKGETLFVTGGGGSIASGIKNRIVAAKFEDGALSDEICSVELEDAGTKLAAHPDGKSLVVAMAKGVAQYVVDSTGDNLDLKAATGYANERMAEWHEEEVTALRFSSDGSCLAFGTDSGAVRVWDFPKLRSKLSVSCGERVSDLDFSPAHGNLLLAATVEGGECLLWRLAGAEGGEEQRYELQKPADLARARLEKCRFARDGSSRLFTVANDPAGSWLLAWSQDSDTLDYRVAARIKYRLSDERVAALDISADGKLLGTVSSEGSVVVYSDLLKLVKGVRQAHMVFGTAATFAEDGHAMVSTSGDASAFVTTLDTPANTFGPIAALLLLLLLLLLVSYLLMGFNALPASHSEL